MEHALICPQCNAPLSPSRFARSVVCSYCGTTVQLDESAVSAEGFHKTLRAWNAPETYGISSYLTLGGRHWAPAQLIGRGEHADVYTARLARWPTELAVLKVLRGREGLEGLDTEWNALQALLQSETQGADTFTQLLPQPILHGKISAGLFAGQRASLFRWASGFRYSFEEVMRAYPQGIPPRASIWIWRRILEMLVFVHANSMAHGAVLPAHLLVQEGEHGVRLIGYGCAGKWKQNLRAVAHGCEAYYPQPLKNGSVLNPQLDLAMSARCIAALLGGDPESAEVPKAVPARLAGVVRRVAFCQPWDSREHAWGLREELGAIAREAFGPSQFCPIVMAE
jgi:hypothetical protein